MATKRPLCNYSGAMQELAAGDTIPLASLSDITTRTHSLLASLTADDHTQYPLLAGRAGGQVIVGGTAITDALTLQGTSGDGTLTSPAIQFLTGNNGATVAVTILNDGKVGIGITNPASLLEAAGTIRSYCAGSASVTAKSTDNTTASLAALWATSNDGTNVLASYSHAPARTATRWGFAVGGWTELVASGADNAGMVVGTSTAVPLIFGTNNVERVRITDTGYIGAGTTAPGTKLELYGTGFASSCIRFNNIANSNTETWDIGSRGLSSSASYFSIESSIDGTTFIIRDAKVGIGTIVPTNFLSFGGTVDRTLWLERHTTSNNAGKSLTVQAGSATVGATDKAGGQLILVPGLATGTGESGVTVQGCLAGSTGTADGTLQDMIKVLGNKLGFFNVTPVVKPTAYTQTYATAAKTVPNATASNPPAGGTGATEGAYDTAAHRDEMITSLTNNIADVLALKQVVNALIDDLQALGIVG